MKKYFKLVVIGFFMANALSSCQKDLLQKQPLDILTDAAVWKDPILINAYVLDLYAHHTTMDGLYWPDWDWSSRFREPYEQICHSDEAPTMFNWAPESNWNKGILDGKGGYMEYWEYGQIRSCNVMLEKIVTATVSEEVKQQAIAHTRFIRAFVYFEMVKRYGGVPLILKAQQLGDSLYVKRDTEKKVYDFIAKECDDLWTLLPAKQPDNEIGKATKYAAMALKSRAMLFAASRAKYGEVKLDGIAGIPASDANSYWQAAADASKKIMDANAFSLFNKYPDKVVNYQRIFLDKDNEEIIMPKKYIANIFAHSTDAFCAPESFKGGWGNHVQPTAELVNAYEMKDGSSGVIDWANVKGIPSVILKNKDPRFHASIFYNGSPWQGDSIVIYYGIKTPDGLVITSGAYMGKSAQGKDSNTPDCTKTGFLMKKFLNPALIRALPYTSDQDWPIFRYAETLLNYAEASYELGNTAPALDAINLIRARAGIATLISITLDKIRNERRVELAFENFRFFDLVRWRQAVTVLSKPVTAAQPIYDANTKSYYYDLKNPEDFTRAFFPQHYYFPISEGRINNDPNLVENPGY